MDLTNSYKCPACQAIATTRRNQRPNTSSRGYDAEHRKVRQQLLARFQPGDPCALCGKPMTRRWITVNGKQVSALDLAHNEDRSGWKGLSHRECNRDTSERRLRAGPGLQGCDQPQCHSERRRRHRAWSGLFSGGGA